MPAFLLLWVTVTIPPARLDVLLHFGAFRRSPSKMLGISLDSKVAESASGR